MASETGIVTSSPVAGGAAPGGVAGASIARARRLARPHTEAVSSVALFRGGTQTHSQRGAVLINWGLTIPN